MEYTADCQHDLEYLKEMKKILVLFGLTGNVKQYKEVIRMISSWEDDIREKQANIYSVNRPQC